MDSEAYGASCLLKATCWPQRIGEKNGNNDGLVDYDEFLPWYTSIAEKHYKFVMATAEPEVPIFCSSELALVLFSEAWVFAGF